MKYLKVKQELLKNQNRDFRAGDIRHSNANIDKMTRLLGYELTHTLESGLKESIAWYIDDVKGNN